MNKLLRKLTAVVSAAAAAVTVGGIIGLSALAESYGEQTELDISYGNITISDDSVSGHDSSGNKVNIPDPDGYIIKGTTDTYTVTVSGEQNITLQNATIDLTDCNYFCAFDIGNDGNVTLTLEGVNTIKSGKSCAGIDVIKGETLEITGTGSLTVTGGQYGAGIGTGETSYGNLSCGSVVISGGSVWATGGDYGATVGDGAYYESFEGEAPSYIIGDFCPPKDKVGNELYPCTINNPNSETVYIDGVEFLPKIHSDSEKWVYAYLTNVTHYINVGDKPYYTTLNNGSLEVNEVVVGSAFSINATSGELVYGKDYTYPAETGVLTILSETAVTISNTDNSNSTTDIIVVAKDVSANITLDGVNIDVSGTPDTCAFKIADDSEGNVTITLADGSVNTMISGSGCAGLQKNGANGTLEIKGTTGTLTATGGTNGAGIGGGNGSEGSGIIINGGSVKAVAGTGANAIGGGEGKAPVTPTNGSGKPVYLLTITGASVTVDNVAYTPIDGTVYAYLTEGEHTITVDGNNTTNHYLANTQNNLVAIGTNLTITADSGEALVYGKDYTYPADTGVLTILSDKAVTISNTDNSNSTTDTIVVAKHVLANITLNGVSIDVSATSGKTAFEIAENSTGNVTVTLAGDNTLKSGEYRAGLQKNGSGVTIGTLTIQGGTNGTGTLTATGGDGGAGIGGGYMGAAKTIVIENATVTAKGDSGIGSGNQGGGVDGIQIINSTVKATGSGGAGIGGSDDSSLSNLFISNSTVTATGGASGIGGGTGGSTYEAGDCTNVTIEDSVVVATGSGGAGIGTGNPNEGFNRNGDGFSYCKDITITNSVVTAKGSEGAAGIGGGVMGQCENVEIYGSSVIAEGNGVPDIGWGKYSEKDMETNEYVEYSGKAVNATSSGNPVYPFTIANPTGAAVIIDDTEYAYANHSAADKTDTNLYAYFTGEAHTVTIGEVTTEYKFYDGIFLPVPKASDFTFTAPENLKYTGMAKTATVTSDKNGMGVITTKYYNASGDEVTQGADFVPGTYTVKIDVAKGDKYVEATDITDASWKFTITAGDLTVSGTGKASGTFGDKLSELTVSGLTAKFGDTEIKGTWALSGNTIPNVGDSAYYTATFTPNENADRYNELTAEVSLDIAKEDAPEIEDIKLTYSWAATGEKTATVSGLPDNLGTLGKLTAEISDENSVLTAGSASYSDGKVYFTLNSNTEENVGNKATIKVTLPSQNYKDITFSVIVAITAKLDKDAPAENEFELSFDLLSDNTYKATITTALTGVEFSFDGVNWSSTNTKAVGHAETVTGYIRYEETDEYNVSPYSSKTAATGHGTLTHHDAKAAICTEDGNIEYWTCDSCKLYFSDANGTTEITQAQTVLTKLGHKWAEKYNFDKDGHWHKCEVCGDTSEKEAHVSGGAATADSAEICTVCSYEIAPKLGQEPDTPQQPDMQEPPKKGDVVKDDKTSVKVEVSDVKKKEVEYKEPVNKKAKTVSIPATVKINGVTYKVTKIADNAFKNNKTVTKVTVGSNIKTIGKNAFYKCTKLKTVKIGKNVTEIGANAFKGCSSLTSVTLPSKATKIGANAFSGCKKLKTIKITSTKLSSKTVAKNAFKGLTKATTIKVPKKKLSAYKKLFKQKGLSSKVTVKGY